MTSNTCFVLLTVLWWASWTSRAGGAPTHDTIKMDLAEVLDKSVCPMRVVIDEDKTRTPRFIKTLQCDKNVNQVCQERHGPHACCHHRHNHFNTECVELIDRVVVRYEGEAELTSIPVAVGCSCMVREGTRAVDAS